MAFRRRSFRRRTVYKRRGRRAAPVRRRVPMGRRTRRVRRRTGGGNFVSAKFTKIRPDLIVPINTTSVVKDSTAIGDVAGTGSGQFFSLYHQYRINRVKVQYIPRWSQGLITNGAGGYVYTYLRTRVNSPTVETLDQAMNASGCKRRNFYKPFTMYYKPTVTNVMSLIPGSTAAADLTTVAANAGWLDTDSFPVHEGHGLILVTQGIACTWEVIKTLYVSFRGRRI